MKRYRSVKLDSDYIRAVPKPEEEEAAPAQAENMAPVAFEDIEENLEEVMTESTEMDEE